jgi:hypothetical protein
MFGKRRSVRCTVFWILREGVSSLLLGPLDRAGRPQRPMERSDRRMTASIPPFHASGIVTDQKQRVEPPATQPVASHDDGDTDEVVNSWNGA